MYHGSLFSGLGGFDLAASWVGWDNTFHSDIDPFCLSILKHHFPNATTYSDIRGTDFMPWRNRIDVLSGGFPCQPFSQAGKRKGTSDDRHLWPEMLRAIREIRPRWVVGENVLGITNWNGGMVFEQVCADLETENYSVQPFVLPACGANAPHQRYRTWFVAHRNDDQLCAGLQFDQWNWTTTLTDGGIDVRYAYRDGACAQSGTTGEPRPESGRVCGTGSLGADQDGNGRGSRANPPATAGTGVPAEDGSRAATDSCGCGYERRNECSGEEVPEKERIYGNGAAARSGIQRPVADPQSGRFQRRISESGRADGNQTERLHLLDGVEGSGVQRTVTHAEPQPRQNERTERGNMGKADCGQPTGRFEYGDLSKDWLDFPTQSPVCSRDDGFPIPMDGITFPRWRKESIKAYGNAIVPQLAYRIFRVIEFMSNGK